MFRQQRDKPLDGVVVSLSDHLDPVVHRVARVADEAELEGACPHPPPEPHALDVAVDERGDPRGRHRVSHWARHWDR